MDLACPAPFWIGTRGSASELLLLLQSRRTPRDWLNTCKRQTAWPVSTQFKHVPPKATRYRSYTCPHFTYSAAHCLNHKMQRAQQAGATQAKAQLAIFPAGASAALSVRLCLARLPKACYSLTFPAETAACKTIRRSDSYMVIFSHRLRETVDVNLAQTNYLK